MRPSTLLTVLCAAGAFAIPLNKRVDVVKEVVVTDVIYTTVTDVVATDIVTAGNAPSTTSTTSAVKVTHHDKPYELQVPAYTPQSTTTAAPKLAPKPSSSTTLAAAVTSVVSSTESSVAPSSSAAPLPVVSSTESSVAPSSSAAPLPVASSASPPSPPPSSSKSPSNLPKTFVKSLDPASQIYQGLSLQHHNVHRANHSASDLAWNSTLATYAETTAKTCVWAHSLAPGGGGYGQNIAAGGAPGNISATLSNDFYNGEIVAYGNQYGSEPSMGNFDAWGHFSQMIWKDSQSVGCYTATCSPSGADPQACNPATGQSYLKNLPCGPGQIPAFFTVCNYFPAGNMGGTYGANMKAPSGAATVLMTSDGVVGL